MMLFYPPFSFYYFFFAFASDKRIHTGDVTFLRLLLVLIDTGVKNEEEEHAGKAKSSFERESVLRDNLHITNAHILNVQFDEVFFFLI